MAKMILIVDDSPSVLAILEDMLDELGYEGWVGCEYHPRGETVAGLGWLQDWA